MCDEPFTFSASLFTLFLMTDNPWNTHLLDNVSFPRSLFLENFGEFVYTLLSKYLPKAEAGKDILELGSGLGYLLTALSSLQEERPQVLSLMNRIQETEEAPDLIEEVFSTLGRTMMPLDARHLKKKVKPQSVTAVILLNILDANPLCFYTESLLKDIHHILKPKGYLIHIKDLPILPDLLPMVQPFLPELSPFPFFSKDYQELGIQWLNPNLISDRHLQGLNADLEELIQLFILSPEQAISSEYPLLQRLANFIQDHFSKEVAYAELGRNFLGWALKIHAIKTGFHVIENKTLWHDTLSKEKDLYLPFLHDSHNGLKHEDADLLSFQNPSLKEKEVLLKNLIHYTVLQKK